MDAKLTENGYNTILELNLIDPTYVMILTCKKDSKRRVGPVRLAATFCPFCGIKYEKSEELPWCGPSHTSRALVSDPSASG
jgi:hypothetical protein